MSCPKNFPRVALYSAFATNAKIRSTNNVFMPQRGINITKYKFNITQCPYLYSSDYLLTYNITSYHNNNNIKLN